MKSKINMAIINNLKDYLAKKQIKKVLKVQDRNTYYPDFKSVETVLVLFKSDDDEKNPFIRKVISDLKSGGKKVCVWGLLDKVEPETPLLPEYRLFGESELSFSKVPNKELTDEFLNSEYDIVIQLLNEENYALDYLLAQSRSQFKVSAHKTYKGIADLMIGVDVEADVEFLYEQIMHYLTSIQAKNKE